MDTNRNDNMRSSQRISPTLKSGPRQKPLDSNADEIIRFVRRQQSADFTEIGPKSFVTGIRKKSVLPSIPSRSFSIQEDEPDTVSGGFSEAQTYDTSDQSKISVPFPPDISVNVSIADSGFAEKVSEVNDTNSDVSEEHIEQSSDYDNDNNDDLPYNQNSFDPFKYKQGVRISRAKDGSIIHEDNELKPLNAQSVFAEDQLVSSRTGKLSKENNKVLNRRSSVCISPLQSSTSRISQPQTRTKLPKGGQHFRPRPLPQLPPINRPDYVPDRPSAPSPSLTPPSPRSPVDSDRGDIDYDLDDYLENHPDNENYSLEDNDDIMHKEPVDYIDCR